MQVPNKNYKGTKPNYVLRWAFLVFVWLAIYSVVKSFVQTRRGFSRLDEVSNRLGEVKAENTVLKSQLEMVNSEEYRIRVARDKLKLQKADEYIVVMLSEGDTISLDKGAEKKEPWRLWYELID